MRLSSSSSSSSPSVWFRSLLKRNPVTSAVVLLGCICTLFPLVAGVNESEIDLKSANHDQDHARGDSTDAKYARTATFSGQHGSAHSRKNKPNKSSFKKYVEDTSPAVQHGKETKSIYDKKYFDYMPAEPKDPLDAPTDDVSLAKRTNSRRFRRDADDRIEPRSKRSGYWSPVSAYYPQIPMIILPGSTQVQYVPNNSYRPHLNNHYLPPTVFTQAPNPPDRTYLPPVTQTSQPTEPPGTFDFDNRFGDQDRAFIFDQVYDPSVGTDYRLRPGPRPSTGNNGGRFPINAQGSPASGFGPQPAPRPTSTPSTFASTLPPRTTTPRPRPTTTRPSTTTRRGIQHNSDDEFDWSTLGLSPDAVGTRIGEDDGNVNRNTLNSNRKRPSSCTWAIANCCSQFSDKIRYYCFEQNQCYGAFWGDNVCRGYYRLALAEIENFYSNA